VCPPAATTHCAPRLVCAVFSSLFFQDLCNFTLKSMILVYIYNYFICCLQGGCCCAGGWRACGCGRGWHPGHCGCSRAACAQETKGGCAVNRYVSGCADHRRRCRSRADCTAAAYTSVAFCWRLCRSACCTQSSYPQWCGDIVMRCRLACVCTSLVLHTVLAATQCRMACASRGEAREDTSTRG
jgi:hypothetical protein